MVKFTTTEIAHLFKHDQNKVAHSQEIFNVFIDSRKSVNKGLFIPIVGENFDGHDFILQAIENGAVAALWSKEQVDERIPNDFQLLFVNDTIEALQQLAYFYRKKINPKVIGITGSNGKTTTKELVSQVLSKSYVVTKTEGNLNNHIGLPLTVLSMDDQTEVLVVEMGMSNFGEIELLTSIARPDIALITNIGESHIEYLGSREGIAKAKLEIIKGLSESGHFIIDGDEPLLKIDTPFKTVYCGFQREHDVYVHNIKQHNDSTTFYMNDELFEIPLLGEHQAKNCAFAYAVGTLLNVPKHDIKDALRNIQFKLMRFEQINLEQGVKIINDAYNASATSMIASINVLKAMDSQKKIVVLGDILELGSFSEQEHSKVGEHIDDQIDIVFTYGEKSKHIINGLPNNFKGFKQHFTSKTELVKEINKHISNETVILFKASRGMKLEEAIEQLISSMRGR
ncbi:UDP-N-acetylmuramoyl-tripeptide--D-alanyl-D-alanine ligase [Bacillaceae bacterium W0354]